MAMSRVGMVTAEESPMKSMLMSLLGVVLVLVGPLAAGADPQAGQGKIRVLLTYGGHGFDEKAFFAMFDAMPDIAYTKAPLPQSADRFKPGLEKEFDVIVMYDMVGGFPAEQQKAFEDLLKTGIGVVSLHHNLGAHRNWDEFRKIIGGKFMFADCEMDGRKHTKSTFAHGQDVKVHVADKEHPITRDLQDFEIHDEVYGNFYCLPEAHVLLTTDHPKSNPQVAWTLQYGKSRVFYLVLGHDAKAWSNPDFAAVVVRGIRWAAGRL